MATTQVRKNCPGRSRQEPTLECLTATLQGQLQMDVVSQLTGGKLPEWKASTYGLKAQPQE